MNGVCFGWQNTFLQVNDVVFRGMETNNTSQEHHGVGKGQSRGKQGCGCEDINDVHIAQPRAVQFLSVHIGVHSILLFIKIVNRLKETVVELWGFVDLSAFPPFLSFEYQIGSDGSDDGGGEVYHDHWHEEWGEEIIAVGNSVLRWDYLTLVWVVLIWQI